MDGFEQLSLHDSILYLIATSVRTSREACELIQGNTNYMRSMLSKMKAAGLISTARGTVWSARLTQKGVDYLAEKNPKLCEYYLNYSSQNHPGSTPAHVDAQCRTSEVLCLMKKAGVKIGIEKPSRQEIICHVQKPIPPDEGVFFMGKELRKAPEQKVGRAQISRATGVLISRGMTALVYNTQEKELLLNRTAEKSTNYQAVALRNEVSASRQVSDLQYSIVVGYDYDVAKQLFLAEYLSKNKRRSVADAIKDRTLTGTDFCFIPLSKAGVVQLRLMHRFSPQDICGIVFDEAQQRAGRERGDCEAVINGLRCFELLTMNLSKLYRVISVFANELDEIGFVCGEEHVEFIKSIYPNSKINLRVIKADALKSIANE